MRLPNPLWPELLRKELAGLLSGRAFWVLLAVLSLLVGLSYAQAVGLYAEASRAVARSPALAAGLVPLEGVLAPTFGGLYLGLTLLFPFVAIRQVARERSDGMLPLLLQTRVPLGVWLAAKLVAMGLVTALVLAIPVSALGFWFAAGGHVAAAETAALILGYGLYALAITGLAYFAAALMDSAAGAAILTLSATLGAWALDFAADGERGWVHALGQASITAVLRRIESGLVTLADVAGLLAAVLAGVAATALCLHPRPWPARLVGVDGDNPVLVVDGRAWSRGQPAAGIADRARALYGERYAEFLDNVKAYAYFPYAVLNDVQDFREGVIRFRFKGVAGRIDQAAGILFDLKPNGDYYTVRANPLEDNLVLWQFKQGKRGSVKWVKNTPTPTRQWHELKVEVRGRTVKSWLDGKLYLSHELPQPVSGRVGLWSKADSVVYFDDLQLTP